MSFAYEWNTPEHVLNNIKLPFFLQCSGYVFSAAALISLFPGTRVGFSFTLARNGDFCVFYYCRGLKQQRPNTFGIWWFLIRTHTSSGLNLVLLPTDALFWNRVRDLWPWVVKTGVLSFGGRIWNLWNNYILKETGPVKLYTWPTSAEQVNWANSRHSGKCGILKKEKQNFLLLILIGGHFSHWFWERRERRERDIDRLVAPSLPQTGAWYRTRDPSVLRLTL